MRNVLSNIPPSTKVLLGLCFLVVLTLLALPWLLQPGAPIALPAAKASPTPAATIKPEPTARPSLQPMTAFAEVEQRPLFRSNRRPLPVIEEPKPMAPQPQPAAPVAAPLQGYVLVGVVLSDGDQVAMLRMSGSGAVKTIRVGDTVDSWQVAQIDEREVIFKNSEREIRITFPVSELGKGVVREIPSQGVPRSIPNARQF